jgi:hypothetical protein
MTPLDLTKGRPRTPQDQLDGLLFFPRTIDKARASLPGGNKGDYNVAPGISDQFLKHFGLEAETFIEAVKNAATEDDVVKWFREHTDASKKASWNEAILGRVVNDDNRERIAARHPVLKRNPSLTRVVDVLEADDRECLGEALAVTMV